LYFLQYVEKKIAKRQLRGRVIFLNRIKRQLEELQKEGKASKKHLQIILDHDLDLVKAEINSILKLSDILS